MIQNNEKVPLLSKNSYNANYRCFYCKGKVKLDELQQVDQKLKHLESEEYEFLIDELPESTIPRQKPYIHSSDLGYDVLNLCLKCFIEAKEEFDSH